VSARNQEDQENVNRGNLDSSLCPLPPKTPNYGKTPKYLEKYKEEFKQQEMKRQEEKAASLRPPGTI
jgi:hypothetical protein